MIDMIIKSRLPKRLFGAMSHYLYCKTDMTFITGANAPFYDSLRDNLLFSLHQYESDSHIVIWDLGLDTLQLSELHKLSREWGNISIRTYPVNDLPPHYDMKNWNYAFKSYCIFHSLLEDVHTRFAFWLDAGCAIRGYLDAERNLLDMYHFYSPYSSTTVGKLTYPSVMSSFFNDRFDFASRQMLSSGVDGFDTYWQSTLMLVAQWYHAGMVEELLAPIGASLENHRYDQSLLSLIYYSAFRKLPYFCRYYYNIKIHLNKH